MKLTGTEHDLKIWPPYFHAVATDLKPWEYRLDDRGFRVGDVLNLREWNPRTMTYTGRAVRRVVTFILHGGFGMPVGYCIMSLTKVPASRRSWGIDWDRVQSSLWWALSLRGIR